MDTAKIINNLKFNANVIHFGTIDSTNTYLKENLNSFDSNTLIIADTQTNGRGKNNRDWLSPIGGLYFSFLIKKNNNNNLILPLIAGLAVVKSLAKLKIDCMLKWPNDIIYENKKLGGILVESKINSLSSSYIVGIGLNISSLLPSDMLKNKFISLANKNIEIQTKENLLIDILNELYFIFNNSSSSEIISEYDKYSILTGRDAYISNGITEKTPVFIKKINDDGSLKIELTDSKELKDIYSGEFSITGFDSYI
ncbi:MAG: biotin--[acetyl-CoA-carboxylase] ligase [Sarcina sp.]